MKMKNNKVNFQKLFVYIDCIHPLNHKPWKTSRKLIVYALEKQQEKSQGMGRAYTTIYTMA